MKLCKRLISVLLAVWMLSCAVFAAGSVDPNRDIKLTISYQDDGTPLVGAEFNIYLVASMDENGELTTERAFQQFNVDIHGKNDEAWKTLATTLEGYVLRDQLAPTDSGKTDDDGFLHCPTGNERLTPGLYLVLGSRHTQDGFRYDAMPFMTMLPTQDTESNEWVYDVLVEPKFEASALPEPPSTVTRKVLKVWDDDNDKENRPAEVIVQLLRDGTVYDTVTLSEENNWRYTWSELDDSYTWTVVEEACEGYNVRIEQDGITFVITNTRSNEPPNVPPPDGPVLPQTGQLWWPVPLLMMGGLLFILVGLACRKRKENGKTR